MRALLLLGCMWAALAVALVVCPPRESIAKALLAVVLTIATLAGIASLSTALFIVVICAMPGLLVLVLIVSTVLNLLGKK